MNLGNLTRLEHESLADAAICIFDHLVPNFFRDAEPSPWEDWRERVGSAEVRLWCIRAAPVLDRAWDACRDLVEGEMCFDFEFVPEFLDTMVVWDHGYPDIPKDAPTTFHNLKILEYS